jgi:hypothetical protein
MWMERTEFRDWKTFLSTKYSRPSKWANTAGETVPFMKIRWFNYGVGEDANGALIKHPNEVWYRLSLDPKEAWKRIALQRGLHARDTGVISDARYELYPAALALDPKKVADLAKFKAWLPLEFHKLYPDPIRKRKGGEEKEEKEEKEESEGEPQEKGEEEGREEKGEDDEPQEEDEGEEEENKAEGEEEDEDEEDEEEEEDDEEE